jgi:ABC-type Fe3+ transport system substrate-binding protein
MPQHLHMALPPNIARQVISEIQAQFPNASIHPPQTHDEMDDFFKNQFGCPQRTADLTLTVYPSALTRASASKDRFASMPGDLPKMRGELRRVGLKEPSPFFRVVAVVTMIIIHHKNLTPPISGWADLCREDIAASVITPPPNTPAPTLYAHYLEKLCGVAGRRAATRVRSELLPQDINKTVDEGLYKAGMVFPAFARTFRLGNTLSVWPKEGAIAVPLMAFLKNGASETAVGVLKEVFGKRIQTILAENGHFCAIREDVALFPEMVAHDSKLVWTGWEDYIELTH